MESGAKKGETVPGATAARAVAAAGAEADGDLPPRATGAAGRPSRNVGSFEHVKAADHLPEPFVAFLRSNGLDSTVYALSPASLPRFVRSNPRAPPEHVTAAALSEDLGTPVTEVPWLPGFFSLDGSVKIARSRAYTNGYVYGMDASSGTAVRALDPQPGERVLDLCCAPGTKLAMIADAMGCAGELVGVDVSRDRAAACCTVLKKYGIVRHQRPQRGWRCAVCVADGTTFSGTPSEDCVLMDSKVENSREGPAYKGAPPPKKRARVDVDKVAEEDAAPAAPVAWFDRVIVDAECTHDGSIKHVAKFAAWGWETFEKRFLDPERISGVVELQRKLLANGFRLLRPGGSLVYSTCSLTRAQNEEVVQWLLDAEPQAELAPIPSLSPGSGGADGQLPWEEAGLPHTLRFNPLTTGTSGLFIARLTKAPPAAASAAGVCSTAAGEAAGGAGGGAVTRGGNKA